MKNEEIIELFRSNSRKQIRKPEEESVSYLSIYLLALAAVIALFLT